MVEVVEVLRKIRSFILAPFGLLFGLLVRLRYKLYEIGLLKSHKIPLPTISIGNISVGGTGKTPLTNFIASKLKKKFKKLKSFNIDGFYLQGCLSHEEVRVVSIKNDKISTGFLYL